MRTFDLPTGRLIDAFRTPSVAISLSFSPTGDFLATAHVESMGVFLWYVGNLLASIEAADLVSAYRANRAQLTEVSHKTFSQEDEIPDLALPTIQGQEDEDEGELPAWAKVESLLIPAQRYLTWKKSLLLSPFHQSKINLRTVSFRFRLPLGRNGKLCSIWTLLG